MVVDFRSAVIYAGAIGIFALHPCGALACYFWLFKSSKFASPKMSWLIVSLLRRVSIGDRRW